MVKIVHLGIFICGGFSCRTASINKKRVCLAGSPEEREHSLQFGSHSGNPGLIFARLLRISRNSCGPLISLCLRSCRSSSVANGSPRRSISSPAISDALARRSSMPDQCSPRRSSTFWRVREIARADRQRSPCAPTRCSHWQAGGICRSWTCCPPVEYRRERNRSLSHQRPREALLVMRKYATLSRQ